MLPTVLTNALLVTKYIFYVDWTNRNTFYTKQKYINVMFIYYKPCWLVTLQFRKIKINYHQDFNSSCKKYNWKWTQSVNSLRELKRIFDRRKQNNVVVKKLLDAYYIIYIYIKPFPSTLRVASTFKGSADGFRTRSKKVRTRKNL